MNTAMVVASTASKAIMRSSQAARYSRHWEMRDVRVAVPTSGKVAIHVTRRNKRCGVALAQHSLLTTAGFLLGRILRQEKQQRRLEMKARLQLRASTSCPIDTQPAVFAERIEELGQWLIGSGGRVSPNVALQYEGAEVGMGVSASEDLEVRSVIVAVPPSCQVRWATEKDKSLEVQQRVQRLIEVEVPPELWDFRLAGLVLSMQQGAMMHKWTSYVACLPPQPPDLPLFWRGKQLQESIGMYPDLAIETTKKARLLQSIAKSLAKHGEAQELLGPMSTLALARAYAVVSSRAIRLQGRDGALAPLLDFANHSFTANVELCRPHIGEPLAEHLVMIAKEPIKRGTPLTLDYGPHANQQLLLDYGFTVPGNLNTING